MKTRKLIVAMVLVAILLVGTALTVNAAKKIRLTGGMNYPYRDGPEDEVGWAWATMNITLDPETGKANGFANYRSYSEEDPKNWGGWYGTAICGSYGDYNGSPAVVLVIQLQEADVWTPGYYIKLLIADGGENASEDFVGLIVFPPVEDEDELDCEFEMPMPYPWATWYGVNGNVTIHE